jgi:hypothetical protein
MCNILFPIVVKIKSKQFIKFLLKLNVKASPRRLKPDSCQSHQRKIDRLTPGYRQAQTPLDPIICASITSFVFLATRFSIVGFFLYSTSEVLVQSCVTCIDYYTVCSLIKLKATVTSRLLAGTSWLVIKRYKVFLIRVSYPFVKTIKSTSLYYSSFSGSSEVTVVLNFVNERSLLAVHNCIR